MLSVFLCSSQAIPSLAAWAESCAHLRLTLSPWKSWIMILMQGFRKSPALVLLQPFLAEGSVPLG